MKSRRNTIKYIVLALFLIGLFSELLEDIVIGIASLIGISLTVILFLGPPSAIIYYLVKGIKAAGKKDVSAKSAPVQKKPEEEIKPDEPKKENVEKKPDPDYIKIFADHDFQIENEEISDGLVKCQEYLKQIKKIEDEFPETKEKTGKLYSYYLPMLDDILKSYIKLHDTSPDGKELKDSEGRLIKTIDLINGALKSISLSLCQQYYDNMTVDIKTLEALLKKDGYGNELELYD